ncbi:uncharacterized protein LOC142741097 [Rhinoderma darwinii]|uniref:uncharacterized protein LOC142741096 n=1 Tax=Rhinoderma darwinii TaxID=43563 RepID=UPI003F67EAF7
MTSETFAYDQSTTTSILSQVTNSGEFLRIPPQELRTRDYEKELRKFTSHDLHCVTLAEYHRLGRIPRGLRSHLRPTLFSEDRQYCDQFQKILNKCSLDLIILTVEYLQKSIKESTEKIKNLEIQLSSSLSSSEWESLKNRTDNAIKEYTKEVELRKREKFQRDANDYLNNSVYRWQESSGSWRSRRGFAPGNRSTSGSDTSIERPVYRSQRFLGNRRGRGAQLEGRTGEGRSREPGIQTRSQAR